MAAGISFRLLDVLFRNFENEINFEGKVPYVAIFFATSSSLVESLIEAPRGFTNIKVTNI